MADKYGAQLPTDFQSFFPYYLREHAHPLCRALHYFGTSMVLVILAYVIYSGQLVYLLVMPFVGYFFAWVGHFFVEKTNRPPLPIRSGHSWVTSKCIFCLSAVELVRPLKPPEWRENNIKYA